MTKLFDERRKWSLFSISFLLPLLRLKRGKDRYRFRFLLLSGNAGAKKYPLAGTLFCCWS